MKWYIEDSLSNFHFWSGGKDRADLLSDEQFDVVEQMMEECEPEEGWSDTAINDFFWFEFDTICEWLGYADEEHLTEGVDKDTVEEAQEWAEEMSENYSEMFDVAGLDYDEYVGTDEDGDESCDYEQATEDFMEWWDELDDMEKVKEYRKYQ